MLNLIMVFIMMQMKMIKRRKKMMDSWDWINRYKASPLLKTKERIKTKREINLQIREAILLAILHHLILLKFLWMKTKSKKWNLNSIMIKHSQNDNWKKINLITAQRLISYLIKRKNFECGLKIIISMLKIINF